MINNGMNMPMSETISDSSVEVIEKQDLTEPRMWHVILHNDNQTTMEMVVLILMQIFHKSFEEATSIMMHIHEKDSGIAGTYSREVAVHKRDETMIVARSSGYPLKATIMPRE